MQGYAFRIFLLVFAVGLAAVIGLFLLRNPEHAPTNPSPVAERETVASNVMNASGAQPIKRDKAIEAAVDNVFDGPGDEVSFRLVVSHVWKEDDLCLATVLLDYHLSQDRWPLVIDQMFQDEKMYSLVSSIVEEEGDPLAKLGSPESLAEPLLYAQAAFQAWKKPERFEKIFRFLQKNGGKHAANGAYYYLSAVAAAEAGHPSAEVEALLTQAFEAPEMDFGILPFYHRLADAAEASAVNFLALKKLDQQFFFTTIPMDKILLVLFQGKLRGENQLREKALAFASGMEKYGAQFLALAFGSKLSLVFFQNGRILRYLFEHPGYGLGWKSKQDYLKGGLMDAYATKEKLRAFGAPAEASAKAFEAVANETVENRADQCLRGDFDAYFVEWKRARAAEAR